MRVIISDVYRLLANPALDRTSTYDEAGRNDILSYAAFQTAQREIASWEGYSPTPLTELSGLAKALGVRQILIKDEGGRFGLGSFKALGGAYAVCRLLQKEVRTRTGHVVSASHLASGELADVTGGITVTCATDGNHGRSVAWGARTFGCRCIIYVHAMVSNIRRQAIADYGAEIRTVEGNYDDSVRQASADAAGQGWHVVSDTSYEGYFEVPRDVMQGYSVMVEEALNQSHLNTTHVFVQGGVGGLAAAVCAHLWQRYGTARPILAVVEPEQANCLYLSAATGHPVAVRGALETIMAGLACGEVSQQAWRILQPGADVFMTVSDEAAAETMRLLARPPFGDISIVAGESAVAGLAALAIAAASDEGRKALDIGPDSVVLIFGTEGATDPVVYRQIVGLAATDVAAAATTA